VCHWLCQVLELSIQRAFSLAEPVAHARISQ
jgi:hypothetical protein